MAKLSQKLKVSLLGKLFFYLLVLLLPFSTRKIFFTENSYYFGYFSFYNTFFLYLTDLIFFGLILAWISESLHISRFWPFSRLNANSSDRQQNHAKNANDANNANVSPRSRAASGGTLRDRRETDEIASSPDPGRDPRNDRKRSVFASPPQADEAISQLLHRIITRITQDKIYLFLSTFWLISLISLLFSRETGLGLYGLAKISQFMLIFAYIRENGGSLFSAGFLPFSRLNANRSNLHQSHPKNANDANNTNVSPTPSSSPPIPLGGTGGESLPAEARTEARYSHAVFWLILATLWFQAGLGIWQYVNHESAGLVILGEEYLRPGLTGVAKFVSRETLNPYFYNFFPYLSPISDVATNLRAYGTLPHPNVLSGLLFVGIMINLYLLYTHGIASSSLDKLGTPRNDKKSKVFASVSEAIPRFKIIILSLSLLFLTTGLVVTFSRFVWAITFLAIILWFVLIFLKLRKPQILAMKVGRLMESFYRPKRLALVSGLLLIALGLNLFLFGAPIKDRLFGLADESARYVARPFMGFESLEERKVFSNIAWAMIKQNPLFGVGLKNFTTEMDSYSEKKLLPFMHQPAHNIYLLITAESGILALVVFVILLYYILRRRQRSGLMIDYTLLIIMFGLLGISLFDHYFWTIQQGQLAFWILLGLFAANGE